MAVQTWGESPGLGSIPLVVLTRASSPRPDRPAWEQMQDGLAGLSFDSEHVKAERSRALSSLFVMGPVTATLFAIVRHDGRFGLVADDQDSVALGAFLYCVIRIGRWWQRS